MQFSKSDVQRRVCITSSTERELGKRSAQLDMMPARYLDIVFPERQY